ncbi:MAG: ABC transporter permease [Aristaeellaceae bacterium]
MRTIRNGRAASQRLTKEDWQIYSFLLPAATLIILFSYMPMYGIVLAFQNYRAGDDIFALGSVQWVGLKWFRQYMGSTFFARTMINTIRLSVLNLIFGFTMPIIFALALNEIRCLRFKKFVQTASYLPYFISTVVVAGIVISFTEMNGLINNMLGVFGIQAREWLVKPEYFPGVYTITNVWKTFGFGSILYFSTLSSIDPALYEAARIDGASRWQQMKYITLPGIAFIIAVQLVMQMGQILNANTDLVLLLYRSSTYKTSDIIGTYVYRMGIEGGKYSYTTAVGLFQSVIALTLTVITNHISNRLTGYGLW